MPVFGHIYVLTNHVTGKKYVGQTVHSVDKRFKAHMRGRKDKYNLYLHKAVSKYGADSFSVGVLENASSREELDSLEILFIKELNTLAPNGYNLTEGGGGCSGWKHSDETRRQMSYFQKERLKNGARHGFLGKKHSEETKQKIGSSPRTDSWRRKISASKKGKPSSNGFRFDPKRIERAFRVMGLRKEGFTYREISKKLGMSATNVGCIVNRKTFPHIHAEGVQ